MKTTAIVIALVVGVLPATSFAGNHSNGNNGNGNGNGRPFTEDGFCPPGLANRNPPCVPPGQAAKYGIGDEIEGNYIILENPFAYGLDADGIYYVFDGFVYEINEDTQDIITLIGAIGAVLN